MDDLFKKIKLVAPIIYLNDSVKCIPTPVNTDTAKMVFVEVNGIIAGFPRLTEEERASVTALLQEKPTGVVSQNSAVKGRVWEELKVEEKDALQKELLERLGWLKDGKVV